MAAIGNGKNHIFAILSKYILVIAIKRLKDIARAKDNLVLEYDLKWPWPWEMAIILKVKIICILHFSLQITSYMYSEDYNQACFESV